MLVCDTPQYDKLYAPWLEHPHTLLAEGGYNPQKDRLLDLCGGSGVQTLAALRVASWVWDPKEIVLFDMNPRLHTDTSHVRMVRGDAHYLDQYFNPESFDLVACRQALGYLDPTVVFPHVHQVLAPRGRFVFNTFAKPSRASVDAYPYDGDHFAEGHVFLFGRVLHAQIKLTGVGRGFDLSLFQYHSESKLRAAADGLFQCQVTKKGRSLHWVCTKA